MGKNDKNTRKLFLKNNIIEYKEKEETEKKEKQERMGRMRRR